MAIFQKALNPFSKIFGDMSNSGRNNTYANAVMFNAMSNKLAEGRQLAAANNLSYGGVDDQGEHIFAPAGVYQPIQEAAEGIVGLLDSRPLPPADMGLMQQEGPRIFPPTHGDPLPPEMLPAPIDPINNMYQEPITDDPYQYAQPDTRPPSVQVRDPMTEIPGPGRDPIFFEEVIPDPPMVVEDQGFIEDELAPIFRKDPSIVRPDPLKVVQDDILEIEEAVPFGAPIATATPIGQPIDTGINPFYAGATNVAQPPSMTPVAPSFGLDVGVGSYGTPTNTAGFYNQVSDVGNIGMGGFGGFNIPSTLTLPEPTPTTATGVAPQTTTTPLPTVNSFAGFNGFGGFGGF